MALRHWLCILLIFFPAYVAIADGVPSISPDNVALLKWLDTADADKTLRADTQKGIHHFYVVCGLACSPDPLDKIDTLQCFPSARYLWLKGTTDTPASAEESRLLDKAQNFAWHYNMALSEYLSKHSMTSCVVGEDWERAREDMNRRLAEDDNHIDQNKVTVAYDKQTRRFRFVAYLTPEQRNDDMYRGFCARSAFDHLSGRIIIEIHDSDTRGPLSSIECRYGQVIPSNWISKPDDDYDLPGFKLD
jgi:hypothetical protein